MSLDGGFNWYTPSGVTASFNASGFTHQFMGVGCGNQSGSGSIKALVTHFAFQ
jgi:hypothetical protein